MDIATGLSAASNGLSIAAWLKKVGKDYDAAEFKMKIAELVEALADAKLALSEAKDGLAERDKEISRLKSSFEAKTALVKGEGGYRFEADERGQPVGYPVCPRCEQVDGRIIQTKEHERSGVCRCPSCLQVFDPVVCYLPSGSGYETKQAKESAEWDAAMNRRSESSSFY